MQGLLSFIQGMSFIEELLFHPHLTEVRDVPYSGVFNVYVYSECCRDMKVRPLFGRSPLFGVSIKREFTVYEELSSRVTDSPIVY